MATRIDRNRLKSERLKRSWSQEQLADISGLHVRTIQRLEQEGQGSPISVMALAHAMGIDQKGLTAAESAVRRVTPITILDDISVAVDRYRHLGFSLIETDAPGCVGLKAGATYLIFCTRAELAKSVDASCLDAITGKTLPYIWVRSVDEAKTHFDDVCADVMTPAGVREAVVCTNGEWAILADTITPPA